MIGLLPASSQRHLWLGIVAVFLVALTIYPWLMPSRVPAVSATPAKMPASAPIVPPLPPIETFSSVFDRPLFSPSRRPPATQKPLIVETGLAARYQLIGLVIAGPSRHALITEGKRRFEIREGSALDGWTVLHIEHDQVLLELPRGQAVLTLRRTGRSPARPSPH